MVPEAKGFAAGVLYNAVNQFDVRGAVFDFPGIVPAPGQAPVRLIRAVRRPAADKLDVVRGPGHAVAAGIKAVIMPLGHRAIASLAVSGSLGKRQ